MMAQVPKADVIVTNPTHLAIAIQYDYENMMAPKVVAKGKKLIAEKIKERLTPGDAAGTVRKVYDFIADEVDIIVYYTGSGQYYGAVADQSEWSDPQKGYE